MFNFLISIVTILALFFNHSSKFAADLNFYLNKSQPSNTVYNVPGFVTIIIDQNGIIKERGWNFMESYRKIIRNLLEN